MNFATFKRSCLQLEPFHVSCTYQGMMNVIIIILRLTPVKNTTNVSLPILWFSVFSLHVIERSSNNVQTDYNNITKCSTLLSKCYVIIVKILPVL